MATVLIADDETIIAAELKERLTAMGNDVIGTAQNGEAIVKLALEKSPDLILMDIKMPGKIDGIEAANNILELIDVPIIFLTAYSDSKTIERAKNVNSYSYILKPFQGAQLNTAIEMALYKHSMDRKLKESELRYQTVVENQTELIVRFDKDLNIEFANSAFSTIIGFNKDVLNNHSLKHTIFYENSQTFRNQIESLLNSETQIQAEHDILISKEIRWYQWNFDVIPLDEKKGPKYLAVGRNITEIIRLTDKLKETNQSLKEKVKERTVELEDQATELREANIALKVLLRQIKNDNTDAVDNIQKNLEFLIQPNLLKIKRSKNVKTIHDTIEIVEENLNTITSKFVTNVSTYLECLTSTQLQVANLVKQGKSNKLIADALNLSIRTVETHRFNIRKKLNISNSAVNLRTFLLSLE